MRTLHGHTDTVNVVALSADGRPRLSGQCGRPRWILWDVQNNKRLASFPCPHTPQTCALGRDSRTVVAGLWRWSCPLLPPRRNLTAQEKVLAPPRTLLQTVRVHVSRATLSCDLAGIGAGERAICWTLLVSCRMSTHRRPQRPRFVPGLPLGWNSATTTRRPMGFATSAGPRAQPELLRHDSDAHLLTIAPTGAGKGRSGVIPALLTHPGPTLTIDIKGENYLVAARRRRQLGHHVVGLDPFHLVLPESDGLNPFDLFALPGCQADCDLEMLSELVAGGTPMMSKDLFWDITGRGLLTGLIGLAAEDDDPTRRHLGTVLDHLFADDVDYNIAVKLDSHQFRSPLARQELVAYLSHEER